MYPLKRYERGFSIFSWYFFKRRWSLEPTLKSALTCNLNSFLESTHRGTISDFIIVLKPICRFFYTQQIIFLMNTAHYVRDKLFLGLEVRLNVLRKYYKETLGNDIEKIREINWNRFEIIESYNWDEPSQELGSFSDIMK